jgi:DNA gyrase subunit B
MIELIKNGHVYLAQPPLFRVRSKKSTYYVQTEEEMKQQLLERGLADVVFRPSENTADIQGDDLESLCKSLASMEEALTALERRGVQLKTHAERMDPESGKLPVFHVVVGRDEHWFASRQKLDDFIDQQEAVAGRELPAETSTKEEDREEDCEEDREESQSEIPTLHITELHEVRSINSALSELKTWGFDVQALIPLDRTGLEGARYMLHRGDSEIGIEDLRGLLVAVRELGQRGLQVTRFKGLGEMNAEELRDTTLDPAHRTLIKISMADVGAADNLFRVLMGDKVEPRREFIEKHALEVDNLDV